jgi:Domain of unknown function (DUF4760)
METMATHEDANLILRLYELRRDEKMRQARAWFVANFYVKTPADSMALCPPGSEENAYLRMVTSYWEMVASFLTSGVLNEELFFQSGQELLLTWIRVEPLVSEMRKMMGNPNAWKNLEATAQRYSQYLKSSSPGAYEAFVARIGSRPEQAAAEKAR